MPTPKLTCPRCGGPVALVDATVTSPWTWERGYLVLPLPRKELCVACSRCEFIATVDDVLSGKAA